MTKKIYDIKPPKKTKKGESNVKEIFGSEKTRKIVNSSSSNRRRKEKRSMKLPLIVGGVVVLLGICAYLFFALPNAKVYIWPKVSTVSFQQTITADKSASAVDATNAVIPAQYFEVDKTESEDFPATGSEDGGGTATGTITVFNKSTPAAPITLKAGTHFLSDSGKLFVSSKAITIPAAKGSGSNITPGSAQVAVTATANGSDYNIAASNFSVPGLKGTAYYFTVYATSSAAMTGGADGTIKEVTDDDIQGASDVITKKLIADATAALKSQIPAGYVLLDGAVSTNVTNAATTTKSGTVADSFTYQASITATALAFKKSDLDQFANDYIISQIPDGQMVLANSLTESEQATAVDTSGGTMTLAVNFSAGTYQNIDTNSLALSLLGENAGQVNQTIQDNLGGSVLKTKINFWPFWVKSVPNNKNAITIYTEFK